MLPNDLDDMANNEDTDHTVPLQANSDDPDQIAPLGGI